MNRREVEENLIFLGKTGSQAYGTNVEGSDLDLKGILIAPRPYYLGNMKFEQKDSWGEEEGTLLLFDECKDKVVYELRKFMELVVVQNPNILDLLWLDVDDIIISSPFYEELRSHRDVLLSKKVFKSFTGYANAQLKRMENHRAWLLAEGNGIGVKMPEPKDYLPPDFAGTQLLSVAELNAFYEFLVMLMKDRIHYFEEFEMIRKGMALVDWKGLIKQHQLPLESFPYIERTTYAAKDYLTLLHATQTYNSDLRKYQNWKSWKAGRNPARAEGERSVGYDTKNATHCIRLQLMCVEILTEGKVYVKRPDAEYLKTIRNGEVSYEHIIAKSEELFNQARDAEKVTSLLPCVDVSFVSNVTQCLVEQYFNLGKTQRD